MKSTRQLAAAKDALPGKSRNELIVWQERFSAKMRELRSPIVAVFDEDGGLYVGEMTDYPYNTNQPVKVYTGFGTEKQQGGVNSLILCLILRNWRRSGAARNALGRVRRCTRASRARDDRRSGVPHGHCRSYPGRRFGLPYGEAW